MGRFLIEDNYYVVVLDNCYALGKATGKRTRNGEEDITMDLISYHATPEKILSRYLEIRQAQSLAEACDGTIGDMVRILSTENKRLSDRLKAAFAEVSEWDRE